MHFGVHGIALPEESERGSQHLWNWATGSCEVPCGVWELTSIAANVTRVLNWLQIAYPGSDVQLHFCHVRISVK